MKQDWALLVGFGLAITGCCGALAYVAAGGPEITFTLLAGLAFLAASEIVLLIMLVRQSDSYNAKLMQMSRNAYELRNEVRSKMDMALARITQVQNETRSTTESMAGSVSDLKTSYSSLKKTLASQVANRPVVAAVQTPVVKATPIKVPPPPKRVARTVEAPAPVIRSEPVFDVPVAPPAVEPPPHQLPAIADALPENRPPMRASTPNSLSAKIHFSLEPVVDMRNQRTVHYRLHATLPLGRSEVGGSTLLEQASRSGIRPQMDALAVDEGLALLGKLRQRDPELCIIMPIGPETLADPVMVENIMNATLDAGSTGTGLIFEIRHSVLPMMTSQALEGLAQLSREGQCFALADATPGALDLPAMKTLHVKMVGMDAAETYQTDGIVAAAKFANQARLHGITSLITGMEDPDMVAALAQITPLACGPVFASPRRVKRMAGHDSQSHDIQPVPQRLVRAA